MRDMGLTGFYGAFFGDWSVKGGFKAGADLAAGARFAMSEEIVHAFA
jgi:hypothetical protein